MKTARWEEIDMGQYTENLQAEPDKGARDVEPRPTVLPPLFPARDAVCCR